MALGRPHSVWRKMARATRYGVGAGSSRVTAESTAAAGPAPPPPLALPAPPHSRGAPRSFFVRLHFDHGGSRGMPVALLASPLRTRPEDRGLFSATGTTAFSAFSGMMMARVRSGARAERKAREAH